MEVQKVIVFALNRTGCLDYAYEAIQALKEDERLQLKIFVSEYALAPEVLEAQKIKTYRNKYEYILFSTLRINRLRRSLRRLFDEGFRLLYFPYEHLWSSKIIRLAKSIGFKVVLTIHDVESHIGETNAHIDKLRVSAMENADHLIFLSEHQKRVSSIRRPYSIIEHGPLQINKISRKWNPRPNLLFIGRIGEYKGLDNLSKAVKPIRHKIGKITVAGNPINGYRVQQVSGIDYILKWLSSAEIHDLLKEHDILVLPYIEATQSGVLALGLGSAIPMVISDVGGLKEQVSHAVWVKASVNSLTRGIERLIDSEDLYNTIHKQMTESLEVNWSDIPDLVHKISIE